MPLKEITWDPIADLKIDDEGKLYWKGKPVVTESRLRLETYQFVLAALATFGTLAQGIFPIGTHYGWW